MSDARIIKIVEKAIDDALLAGENWADFVDDRLTRAGVKIHDEQDDGRNSECIVRLADGREVYQEVNSEYGITNAVRQFELETFGRYGATKVVECQTFFQAKKLAREWAISRELPVGSVTVSIYCSGRVENITVVLPVEI